MFFLNSPGLGSTEIILSWAQGCGGAKNREQTQHGARTQLCACPSAFKELLLHKSILGDFRGVKPKEISELKNYLAKSQTLCTPTENQEPSSPLIHPLGFNRE